MSIKNELSNLKELDIWSLMLFVLFKVKDIPEYSSISELAYVLDKKNMLKLCEYFGGSTLRIPTIEELEVLIYGLLLYQYVEIENIPYETALELVVRNTTDIKAVRSCYVKLREVLEQYQFTSRSRL